MVESGTTYGSLDYASVLGADVVQPREPTPFELLVDEVKQLRERVRVLEEELAYMQGEM